MLYEKMNLVKTPGIKKFSFRKKHWYLFPQSWVCKKAVTEIRYKDDDVYEHINFWLIHRYQFSWLFIDISWELQTNEHLSTTEVRYEPVKYVTDKGEILKHG